MSCKNVTIQIHRLLLQQLNYTSICHLSSIYVIYRKLISFSGQDTAATLINAFVISYIDYCNSLLIGSPKCLLHRLKRVKNAAVCVLVKLEKFNNMTLVLMKLHCLAAHPWNTYGVHDCHLNV